MTQLPQPHRSNCLVLALTLLLAAAGVAKADIYEVASGTPAWQANTAYAHAGHFGDRVLAGSPLYLLELTAAGTSGAAAPSVATCPADGIADGGAVWRCLVKVDYVSLSSAVWDDPVHWQPNTKYSPAQIAINNGFAWEVCSNGGADEFCGNDIDCTSGTVGPADTTKNNQDGACVWIPRSAVPYSTGHPWPHQINARVQAVGDYTFNLWHPGASGKPEGNVKILYHQMWWPGDNAPHCPDGTNSGPNCPSPFHHVVIQPAPGEGFCSNPPGTPLAYDPSKGVAFEAVGTAAIVLGDAAMTLNCIQAKSSGTRTPAIDGLQWHDNGETMTNSIIDSTGDASVVADGGNTYSNNLVINRSSTPGASGLLAKYTTHFTNNTIIHIGPAPANSAAIVQLCFALDPDPEPFWVNNNNLFGFDRDVAVAAGCTPNPVNPYTGVHTDHNATDLSADLPPTAPYNDAYTASVGMVGFALKGTVNLLGQSAAATFVDPLNNFQLAPSSPSRGAGAPNGANQTDMFGVTR